MTTVTEKLLTYALGRGLEHYDMPAVRRIVKAAARDGYRFQTIIQGRGGKLSVYHEKGRSQESVVAAEPSRASVVASRSSSQSR